MRRWAAVLLAMLLVVVAHAAAADDLYSLDNGTYRAAAPPDWDGKSTLPFVLYLHGYGQSSGEVIENRDLVAAVTGMGALMVVPDGVRHGWGHVGAPRRDRDDIAFLRAVVDDATRRWPVDRSKVVAAGFSIGGSMVWDLACHSAQGFTAFLPVSGAFWLPYPERCESGPVNLRHVHGLNDPTVPFGGRTIFGTFTQGDVGKGWDILRATDGCAAKEPDHKFKEGDLDCMDWSGCASGKMLELCLHGDGHDMAPRYLQGGLAWALHRAP